MQMCKITQLSDLLTTIQHASATDNIQLQVQQINTQANMCAAARFSTARDSCHTVLISAT